MTTFREMDEVGRDPNRVRTIAKGLLALPEHVWTNWERDFLETRARQREERLSTRQAEMLLELRDDAELFQEIRGVKVRNLIKQCWEARLDLNDEDLEFIEKLWSNSVVALRRAQIWRLKKLAIALGALEDYM